MELDARPLIPIEGHLVVIAVSMKNSGLELMASHPRAGVVELFDACGIPAQFRKMKSLVSLV